jgi:hypothetical protein
MDRVTQQAATSRRFCNPVSLGPPETEKKNMLLCNSTGAVERQKQKMHAQKMPLFRALPKLQSGNRPKMKTTLSNTKAL